MTAKARLFPPALVASSCQLSKLSPFAAGHTITYMPRKEKIKKITLAAWVELNKLIGIEGIKRIAGASHHIV